jgi:hypothetical protein
LCLYSRTNHRQFLPSISWTFIRPPHIQITITIFWTWNVDQIHRLKLFWAPRTPTSSPNNIRMLLPRRSGQLLLFVHSVFTKRERGNRQICALLDYSYNAVGRCLRNRAPNLDQLFASFRACSPELIPSSAKSHFHAWPDN